MIISASRRTDIPNYYSEWFYNRIKEGYVCSRNPMNYHQVSKISLSPDVIDGIVFWTKNPEPMLSRLSELNDYTYYFQFTLTPYGKDIEPNLPPKSDRVISTFRKLSDTIGADRVIWRYDPIIISKKYPLDYHIHAFGKIAEELKGYTHKVIISFLDENYRGVKSNIKELSLLAFPPEDQIKLSEQLANTAHENGYTIESCAEALSLNNFGIEHARCIDDRLLAKLNGCELELDKDKNQRLECGCVTSVDIGMYNTCRNGCRYCYANYNQGAIGGNSAKHNVQSPLISGDIEGDDKVHERDMKSNRIVQMRMANV